MIRINEIKLSLDDDESILKSKAAKALRINEKYIKSLTIFKKSVDARKKDDVHFTYSVDVEITLDEEQIVAKSKSNKISIVKPYKYEMPPINRVSKFRPVIVGFGPAGMLAGIILSEAGLRPIILERGKDIDARQKDVNEFWTKRKLNEESNVQFGEGGAGTFSDGKLNSRIGDPLQKYILKTFVRYGAPKEILYQSKPHIGTDLLRGCVKNIRNAIIKNGGTVRFNSCLTDIFVKDGKIEGIEINGSERLECDRLIAALGHSSRDTYEMLNRRGVAMMQKPFAAGVRIEHTREFINHAQYGAAAARDAEFLPTADYRLAYNGEIRSCYSFCMCPGGFIVPAASGKRNELSQPHGKKLQQRSCRNSAPRGFRRGFTPCGSGVSAQIRIACISGGLRQSSRAACTGFFE